MQVDQAAGLRRLVDGLSGEGGPAGAATRGRLRCDSATWLAEDSERRRPLGEQRKQRLRAIAITSGKGGVGKTNLTVNLAIVLSRMGHRVLVLDGDLGLANVDVLLGIRPRHNLRHVLDGAKSIDQIIVEGPENVKILPGGSGLYDMANLDECQARALVESAAALDGLADILLVDTAAGISANVINLVLAAGEILVVASPEPTSIADAYGLIKAVAGESRQPCFRLVLNMAAGPAEAKEAAQRIILAANRFLDVEVEDCGMIVSDSNVPKAVRAQVPFLLTYPKTPASIGVLALARRLLSRRDATEDRSGLDDFFHRLVRR